MKRIGSTSLWKLSGSAAGLLMLLAILIAANVIVGNFRLRADLTEEDLYTLSEGTRKILGELDQPVTLKLFFNSSSPEVPMYLKNYARQVEDLLMEYRMAARRRVVVEKHDPEPDSDAEDWARRYGIRGQQLGLAGPNVYFGLVAVAGSAEALLPALDPRSEDVLEYHITRLIYRVVHPRKPVVGVLSSLPVLGSTAPPFAYPGQPQPPRQPPWLAFRELQQDFDVRRLDPETDAIGGEIDALMIVHPKDLPDKTLYAIDQFVLRGGRLIVMLDPVCLAETEITGPSSFARPGMPSSLDRLLDAWGIRYDADRVVADMQAVTRLRGADNRIEESLVWLSLGRKHLIQDDILTSQLDALLLPCAGSFGDETTPEVAFTPLIASSEVSGTVSSMAARFGGPSLRREFKQGGMPLPIAVRLKGTFKTAFPEGRPAEGDKADKDPADEPDAESERPPAEAGRREGDSAILLIADVDMIWDRFCVQEMNFFGITAHQPINDNISFLANAVEQMAGSTDLIGIRSRGTFNRAFDRVLALEQAARSEWQAREEELETKLRETQEQLRKIQDTKDSSQRFILSPEQEKAIARFRQEELRTKQQLKDVRKNLRRDIERLGTQVKAANIVIMPLLVSVAGLAYGLYRKKKQ